MVPTDLLQTDVPGISEHWCVKPSLVSLPSKTVTLLHAPPGYGKRSQASYWFHQWPGNKCWLRLSPADNHLSFFAERLLASLGQEPVRTDRHSDSVFTGLLLRQLRSALTESTLIVFDNLHHITDQGIVAFLKELPVLPNLQLIACSQVRHAALFTQAELHDQLQRIDACELRMSDQQVIRFLKGFDLSIDDKSLEQWVDTVQPQFQGWPALWQMAAHLLKQGRHHESIGVDQVCADISDYLVNEVIGHLSAELKDLLYSLCVLDSFDELLASRVSGQGFIKSKLDILQQLQLFLSCDDHHRYFFASFFKSATRHYLAQHDPGRLEVAHHVACHVLLKQGDYRAAGRQVIDSNSRILAIDWLLEAGWDSFHQANYSQLDSIFAILTPSAIQDNTELAILYAWLLLEGHKNSNQAEAFVSGLDTSRLSDQDKARTDTVLAEVYYQYDQINLARRLASDALHHLTDQHDIVSATLTSAMAALWVGELDQAERQLKELMPLANSRQKFHVALACQLRLAQISLFRGDVTKASEQVDQVKHQAREKNLHFDTLYDPICRLKCELHLWTGNLPAAIRVYHEGADLTKPLGDYWWLSYRALELAINTLEGRHSKALEFDVERRTREQIYCRQWRYRAESSLILSYSWSGNINKLEELLKDKAWTERPADIHDVQDNLTFLRLSVLTNKELPESFVRSFQYEGLRPLFKTPLHQMQATLIRLYHQRDNFFHQTRQDQPGQHFCGTDPDDRLISVRQLLKKNYLWDFLLLGPGAVSLWLAIKPLIAESVMALSSLNQVIDLCTRSQIPLTVSSNVPDSRLTRKEWKVLHSIGQGFSNEEIAAQMHVSLATIKTHINRLYSKLEIKNRTQAKSLATQFNRQMESQN